MKEAKRHGVILLLVAGIVGTILPLQLPSQTDSAGADSTEAIRDSVFSFATDTDTGKGDAGDTIHASSHPVIYDSSSFTPRRISQGDLNSYLDDSEFDYARKVSSTPSDSFFQRFLRWFGDLLGSLLGNKTGWDIFQYTVFGAALILVIILLSKSELGGLFKRGIKRGQGIEFEEMEDDITRMDFDRLIADAVAAGNLRRAVRLHYQKLLRAMTEGGMIEWRREKTNGEYLSELRGDAYRPGFAELTRVFDYVWYGGFDVDASLYARIRSTFETFTQRVEKGA